jgi:hypothetical protein
MLAHLMNAPAGLAVTVKPGRGTDPRTFDGVGVGTDSIPGGHDLFSFS